MPGAAPVSYTASHAWNTSIKFNLPGGCLPGSLSIVTDGITIFDDAGLLKTASGTLGTIDYANGILSLNPARCPTARPSPTHLPHNAARAAKRGDRGHAGVAQPVLRRHRKSGAATRHACHQLHGAGPLVRAFGWRQWLPQRAGCQLRRGHFQQEHRGLRRDLGGTARRGLVADPDVERADPGNAAANRRPEGIAGLQLAPPEGKSVQPGTLTITWPHESGTGTRTASATTSGDSVVLPPVV